ncbi:MAG: hypothetical protein JWO91_3718 [Acidobacteriaceae bacterium]|nr:hypothetical protein [Acidobacteriaceae bacterium]
MMNSQEFIERALESPNRAKSHDVQKRDAGDIEIPPDEWESFLASFSSQHEGWLASLSVHQGSKTSTLLSNCRLQRIIIDRTDAHCYANISMLEGSNRQVRSVPDPLHLTFKRDQAGAHQGLEIASADGLLAVLRFRTAVLPETLDGVLPSTPS